PMLSGFVTPSRTRSTRASSRPSSASSAPRSPTARHPRWMLNPTTRWSVASGATYTGSPPVSTSRRSSAAASAASTERARKRHLPALGDEGPVAPAALPVPQVTIVREARIIDVADALDPHSYLQPHALHLRVEVDRVAAELAPVAALLVAAEGRARIEHIVAVDPHRARADGARHPVRLAHVARPHPGGEAVGGVVALQHGVVLVLERDDGDHRAEDLLPRDLHVVPDAGEDGGLHVVALL